MLVDAVCEVPIWYHRDSRLCYVFVLYRAEFLSKINRNLAHGIYEHTVYIYIYIYIYIYSGCWGFKAYSLLTIEALQSTQV